MGAGKKCKTRGRMPIVLPTNQDCETGRFATKHRMCDGKWADRSEGLKGQKAGKTERRKLMPNDGYRMCSSEPCRKVRFEAGEGNALAG